MNDQAGFPDTDEMIARSAARAATPPRPTIDGRQVPYEALNPEQQKAHDQAVADYNNTWHGAISAAAPIEALGRDDDSMTASEMAAAQHAERRFPFTDKVPDGGMIRPWHGAVRYDQVENHLVTAFIPLALFGRLAWRILSFVKLGNLSVNMDPRQSFHDGLTIGAREALANAPRDIQLQQTIAKGAQQKADHMMRLFGAHGMLQERQDALNANIQVWLDGPTGAVDFPAGEFRQLMDMRNTIQQHKDGSTTMEQPLVL